LISAVLFFTSCEEESSTPGYSYGFSVQQTNDEGYIIVGLIKRSYQDDDKKVWVIKTDLNGSKEWSNTFGESNNSYRGYSVQQTSDQGFIITGSIGLYGDYSQDVFLLKTDTNGKKKWKRTFGGNDWDGAYAVQQTEDDGYIITGYTRSFGNGGSSVWLIKTDIKGNEEWNRTYSHSWDDWGRSVQQTTDGGYIIAGQGGGRNVWLIKTDSFGTEEWNKTFGGRYYDAGYMVQQIEDGGYIITGETKSFSQDISDVWIIKTNSNGDEEWNKAIGGKGSDGGRAIQQTIDGKYIVTGYTYSFGDGKDDIWLIKTDTLGNETWNQTFGGRESDIGYSVKQTFDNGYIIVGKTSSFGNGYHNVWLIKTDSLGNEEWNQVFDSDE